MGSTPFRVAVIGAGASGIATGVRLKQAGIAFDIFERANDVGGTWRDNRYPGLACDVPSHLYRYSFAPNAEWTHEYAPAAEIHAYFRKVAEDLGILAHVRLSNEMKTAEYAGDGLWSREEDVYNPLKFAIAAMRWCEKALELGTLDDAAREWMTGPGAMFRRRS